MITETSEREVVVPVGEKTLMGTLAMPPHAIGLILFAHGSGSSRHSPRNRSVARALQNAGFATLLMDLLTLDEEARDAHTGHIRFDIVLLAERLTGAVDWLERRPATHHLPVGLFGASTGAAAALVAAAQRPRRIHAVVSRGGRPDLAGNTLAAVLAPTLLIVGGADQPVIPLNLWAFKQLATTEKELTIVPGAGHLFEEFGALEHVAGLACDWFKIHLASKAGDIAEERASARMENLF